MSMILGSRRDVASEMNVTPLIDVLLVLLVIFMVVLPHHQFGETADIPLPATDPPARPESIVVIQMLDAGENQRPMLKINDEHVEWDSLEKRLREIYQLRIEKVAFLQGHPDLNFQDVADVLDITHRAGVARVGLMDRAQRP